MNCNSRGREYGKADLETGEYAVSIAGSNGKYGRSIRKIKYYNCGMDRNCMYESGNAIYIRKTRALLLWTVKRQWKFVVNLTTEKLKKATDWCGVRSGRDVDKWKEMHLTEGQASKLDYAPIIEECPVNIECKVTEIKELGSHHMFLAKVEAVQVGEEYLDEKGRLQLGKAGLLAYSHGEYLTLGDSLGTFGWSVRKNTSSKKKKKNIRKGSSSKKQKK